MPPRLSLCLIARDEAANLPKCLASLQGLAGEIVLVDTGSRDETPRIASLFAARVIAQSRQDDFSAARNASLDAAQGDWILVLDADEELAPESKSALLPLLDSAQADAYRLIQRNLQPAGELAAYIDLHITRLFRRDSRYRFEGRIHEQITPSILAAGGCVADAPIILLHSGYLSRTAQGSSRAERNLGLLQKALAETPADPYLLYQAGATLKALDRPDEAYGYLRRALQVRDTSAQPNALADEALEQTYMKLAQIALGRQAYPEALEHARACLSLNPRNQLALYAAGLSLVFQNRLREAAPYFQTLSTLPIASPGDQANIRQVLAYIRRQTGK